MTRPVEERDPDRIAARNELRELLGIAARCTCQRPFAARDADDSTPRCVKCGREARA